MTETDRILGDIDAMADAYAATSSGGQLWRTLGEKHRRLIEQFGFENFKRTINFEYGQWGVWSLKHGYTRHLFKSLLRMHRVPYGALARADLWDAANIRWPDAFDGNTGETLAEAKATTQWLRAYAVYCGLLWQFAKAGDDIGCLKLPEPELGNPMPVRLLGRLISQDLAMASLDLNRIGAHISLSGVRRVLEIGAGYGRTAYAFRSLFPKAQYFIVDIPPALVISQNYLAGVFGASRVARYSEQAGSTRDFNFLFPHQLADIPDGFFDLAINISSFDEMPPEVSIGYLKAINRTCRGYVYLNGHAHTSDRGTRLGLEELPYPESWKPIYSGPHAVVSSFVEKIFALAQGGAQRA